MSTTVRPSGVRQQAEARMARNFRLKEQIINRLGLDTTPEVVSDNQPLFGRVQTVEGRDRKIEGVGHGCLPGVSPRLRVRGPSRTPGPHGASLGIRRSDHGPVTCSCP